MVHFHTCPSSLLLLGTLMGAVCCTTRRILVSIIFIAKVSRRVPLRMPPGLSRPSTGAKVGRFRHSGRKKSGSFGRKTRRFRSKEKQGEAKISKWGKQKEAKHTEKQEKWQQPPAGGWSLPPLYDESIMVGRG
jgi:hypothetical protein